jgi:mannosylglycerate hydrolase
LDNLLDHLQSNPGYQSFLLDGQVVLLEDYLHIRPEQANRLKKYIQSGRIIIGPLYTQPDEYIPSAESLVRNFLIGSLICEEYGQKMPIGYFPDSFGQASQIPQILNGFGIDKVVFWRGLCDKQLTKTEFIWESADGSKVTAVWMPFSYGNAYLMPADEKGIVKFTQKAIDVLGAMATTCNILFMRGWDHSGFSPEVNKIIQSIKREPTLKDHEITHSNLELLFDAIQNENPKLLTLKGEFREPKTMRIHAGIDSSRTDLKQLNRKCQTLLEKFIEPICAMNWILGIQYPKPMINQAWKYILQSQAHDSICGCCTDQVARSVRNRFISALEIEESLLRRATSDYAKYQATDQQDGIPIVVINPLPYKRTEIAKAEVVIPFEDFNLCDISGKDVPYQVISREKIQLGIDPSVEAMRVAAEEVKKDLLEEVGRRPDDPSIYYNNEDYVPLAPRAKGIEGQRVIFHLSVPQISACGNQVYFLRNGRKNTVKDIEKSIQTGKDFMENEFIRVDFHKNGLLDILDKKNNATYKNLHLFEDGGDAGDTYNYSPPLKEKIISSSNLKAKITNLDQGPLVGSFRVELNMNVPKGLSKDGQSRSKKSISLKIISTVSLSQGSKILNFHTKVQNRSDDHRVRVLFPSGITCDHSFAEEQFGIIKRPNKRKAESYWKKEKWTENPLPVYPMQTFVFVRNKNKGLAFINKDITEYEIIGKKESIIAGTLFRGIGAMGRPNLVIRPGRASGLEVETPDALLHGDLEFNYGIYPFSDNGGNVSFYANCFNTPLLTVQTNKHPGLSDNFDAQIGIKPTCLSCTCLKKAERENALILRVYNSSGNTVANGKLKLGKMFNHVELANLNEQTDSEKELVGMDGEWSLPQIKSNQILSLKLKINDDQTAV